MTQEETRNPPHQQAANELNCSLVHGVANSHFRFFVEGGKGIFYRNKVQSVNPAIYQIKRAAATSVQRE